jgi:hypothetical protein
VLERPVSTDGTLTVIEQAIKVSAIIPSMKSFRIFMILSFEKSGGFFSKPPEGVD